ncbi:glutathione S-transferase [Glycocaulis albus]|jgi:glutathione S-transferase|uniref:Glutathione S-transferase n=1 Tax=Glycocaulis albus TaxID=1382801 RepID=A0ABQ1XTZ7_9PROT|nr:glutathione S-transferase family protein [Glycocaulis albus]MBV5258868.1 glutathione S-transferase family protein [Synechococcus moorigangaii CMS01]GGH03351.1 glutathione S-transferase [Glycocaulis albus]
MDAFRLYGHNESGNCLKTLWTARHLGLDFEWIEIDIFKGASRTDEFLALNPAGQVPLLERSDGRTLAQSNAILIYMAEGSDLIPADPFDRAKMMEWLFWEQYSHEPFIAVRRSQLRFHARRAGDLDPGLLSGGRRALGVMEMRLLAREYFVAEQLTLADIALVAYTRVAHEGGFDLADFPAVQGWVRRVESALSLPHAGDHAMAG